MNLARFSVQRPVTAGIISLTLFVLGWVYMQRMPVSLFPEISFPFVAVIVPYPGASPEQIEAKILKPLEDELTGVKKLKRIVSTARLGYGEIVLEFKLSANEREAFDAVREKVALVRGDFPKDVKEPIVTRPDVGAVPVLIYGIDSPLPPETTKKLLDETLVRTLRRTEGVHTAEVLGLGKERLELQLEATRLHQLRVPPLEIYQKLSERMALIPWGELNQQKTMVQVARDVLPATPEYWENQTIALSDGRGVRLGDLGKIKNIRDEEASTLLINGKRGLGLSITKRADANTVKVVEAVHKVLAKTALPEGIQAFPIVNQAEYIQENAHEVWIALFIGGAFAIFVILMFLTDIKSALISATALPVSVAGAFIFMYALGFSLNMMSLLALALAIGLLIDDAVVVRESIYGELEAGKTGAEAAISGTDKVFSAVVATSLAVIAVFLPVALMEGMVGQFFREFGMTICLAVAISTWVAFTLDPMLSAYFAGHPKPLGGWFWNSWRSFLVWFEHKVAAGARISFHHPWLVLFIAIGALVGAMQLAASRGADFLAFEDRGQFIISARAPVGAPREQVEALAAEVTARMQGLPGLRQSFGVIAAGGDPLLVNTRLVFSPKTERTEGLLKIMEEARQRLKDLPGDWIFLEPPAIEGLGESEANIQVYIYGEDLKALHPAAQTLAKQIGQIRGITNARLETPEFGKTLSLTLKENEMTYAGNTPQVVELTGRLAITGLEAGNVGTDNIPLFVRLREEDRQMENMLNRVLVASNRGPVELSRFVEQTETYKPTKIQREHRARKIVIWVATDRTRTLEQILAEIETLTQAVPAPFFAELAGDKEMFEEMQTNFSLAILGSLFFIFIILAAQFENFLRPFVILLSLPLAIIGGLLALYLANLQLALGALIGMVLLIGLAAKNGILLVDAVGSKEHAMTLEEAVVLSVLERTRPIVMTSMAMIFGMLPTALMRGGGSEFRAPMAIAIIGGVISSTLLSFQVVPAVFGLIGKWRAWRKRRSTPIKTVVMTLALLSLGGLGIKPEVQAQNPYTIYQLKRGTTPNFLKFVRNLPENSAALLEIKAVQTAADLGQAATERSRWGAGRLQAGRQWFHPGLQQKAQIPLPDLLGGPVSTEAVLIPKEKNQVSFGWQIPLYSLPILESLAQTQELQAQVKLVERAKREEVTLAYAQMVLQFEQAVQMIEIRQLNLRHVSQQLESVKQLRQAGMAPLADELVAQGEVEEALFNLENARTESEKLRLEFRTITGQDLPEAGLGLPQLAFVTEKPLRSAALEALDGALRLQQASLRITEATAWPSISAEIGWEGQYYPESPQPQYNVGVKAEWNFLDGGTRLSQEAQQQKELLELMAKRRDLETQLSAQYHSLTSRHTGLLKSLAVIQRGQLLATEAQKQIRESWRAGLVKLIEVQQIDQTRLEVDSALLEVEFALQTLALESLALTGGWLELVENP